MPIAFTAFLLAISLFSSMAFGQIDVTIPIEPPKADKNEPIAGPPAPDGTLPVLIDTALIEDEVQREVRLRIPDIDLAGGWVELTPLDRPDDRPVLLELPGRKFGDGEISIEPGIPTGQYIVCSGGQTWAVTCEPFYIDAAFAAPRVRFEGGYVLTGTYLLGDLPVEGARVALVPTELVSERPYTMPLSLGTREMVREVETDDDGHFTIPAIAAGEYRLETLLPTGRIHRDVFEIQPLPRVLPPPEATPEDVQELETEARLQAPTLDLGRIYLFEGLSSEIRVLDELGLPVPGAEVIATEGLRPRDLVSFQAVSDDNGVARMSGFTVDAPVRFRCQRDGFRAVELAFDLAPALIECTIERYATVRGEVLGIDGGIPAGAIVALDVAPENGDPEDGDPENGDPEDGDADDEPEEIRGRSGKVQRMPVGPGGRFNLHNLAAGRYHLTVAAPGYAVEEQTFELEPGQDLDLGALVLSAAGELRGLVIDAETEEPLEGIVVEGVNPPGSASAVTDADGEFRVTFPAVEAMVLRLAGVEHAMREILVTADQARAIQPVVIGLHRGGWIQVRVLSSPLTPCQGCQVVIQPIGEVLTTDRLGMAVSGTLQEANYRVERSRMHHLGSTVVEQPSVESKTVRVLAGKTTPVTLGERTRRMLIQFFPSPGPHWTLSLQSGSHSESYFPRADGVFLVNVPDTDQQIEVFLKVWDEATNSESQIWQGSLDPRAPSPATLALPDTRVTARIYSEGRPLAHRDVHIRRLVDRVVVGRVRTDERGQLRVEHLPAGMYTLAVGNHPLTFVSVFSGQTVNLGRYDLPFGLR